MGRRYHKPTQRHNQAGCRPAMVPGVCPFSVMLCNFDVASQMLKFRLALTDEKQREKNRNKIGHDGIRIAHVVAVSPTPHTCVGWRRRQNRAETSH